MSTSEQTYSRWFTTWPSTHERAGQTVEVIAVDALMEWLRSDSLDWDAVERARDEGWLR